MVDIEEFLLRFSVTSLLLFLYLFRNLKKKITCMGRFQETKNLDPWLQMTIKKPSIISRKRPAKLILPPPPPVPAQLEFAEMLGRESQVHVEVGIRGYYSLANKKGMRREFMEDCHGVILDVLENPKQVSHSFILLFFFISFSLFINHYHYFLKHYVFYNI